MKSIRKFALALAVIALIGAVVRVSESPASASSTSQVFVTNSSLPVSAAQNGSWSVNAAQSGPWSVGQSGTWNVAATQSGQWNVGIAGTPTVNIASSSSDPVQVADAEKLARIPYSSSAYENNTCPQGVAGCIFNFTPPPSGYRLVVDNVSGYFQVSPAATAPLVGYLEDSSFRVAAAVTAPLGQVDPGGHIQAAFNLPTKIYNDPGQGLFAVISTNWSNGASSMVLTGYLENCSITGCPPVQH